MKNFILFLFIAFSFIISNAQTVGSLLNTEESYNGYTLFIGGANTIYLIDNCGEMVNAWTSQFNTGLTAYLDEEGNMIRAIQNQQGNSVGGAGQGGGIEKQDWYGNVIWEYDANESGSYIQHHDIEPLPNGNVLVLAWEGYDPIASVQAGYDGFANSSIQPTYVFEVQPSGTNDGNIVWEWRAFDHLIQDVDATKDNFGVIEDHPERIDVNAASFGGFPGLGVDLFHCNAVEYIPEFDLIALSSLTMDEFWIIDHSTSTAEAASSSGGNYGKGGDLLYRWGNPSRYGGTLPKHFEAQHDVHWYSTPDESIPGFFTVFNNGMSGRLDVIIPDMNADGSFNYSPGLGYLPVDPEWTFDSDATSQIGCSFRVLPNGNAFYADANNGLMKEITEDGNLVWHYQNPVNNQGPVSQGTQVQGFGFGTFRAERYSPDYSGLQGKDLTPMGPIELNPLPSYCEIFPALAAPIANFNYVVAQDSSVSFTDNSSGQIDSWLWDFGNGDTSNLQSPSYIFNESGNYNVCLTVENAAGFSTVCDSIAITIAVNVDDFLNDLLKITPNPVQDQLFVVNIEQEFYYEIFNLNQQKISSGNAKGRLNVESLRSGIYFLRINVNDEFYNKKFIKN